VTGEAQSPKTRKAGLVFFLGLAVALGLADWGISSRLKADTALARATEEAARPTVATIAAKASPSIEEITLPGTVQAEYDTSIYARTSGYVKKWYVDIGGRVKAGDLLAEIDSPEVDHQLAQARAQLIQMQASLTQSQRNMELAQITNTRTARLVGQGWSSQQQGDQDRLTFASSTAAVDVALANVEAQQAQVKRLEQLTSFERVVAPFDGIVTSRQVDIGNLINAGSSSGAELFRVADMKKLRVYVQVPQSYVASITNGLEVELRFPEHPGRIFPARLVRSANAIEPRARTLLVELEVDNAKGELLPGGYTDVRFKLPIATRGVRISANALLFRAEGPQVATADANGRVVLHTVSLGRDFGTAVEVLTGIAPNDAVIINPPASIVAGAEVRVKDSEKLAVKD